MRRMPFDRAIRLSHLAFIDCHQQRILVSCTVALLVNQELGAAVNVNFACHRFAFRQPAATASASVQNQRSPFYGLILVRS